MSMIKCPECGQPVSSRAPMCPHCGVPIMGNVKRCPKCGGFALMDARQCPSCDARFAVTTNVASTSTTTHKPGPQTPVQPDAPTDAHSEPATDFTSETVIDNERVQYVKDEKDSEPAKDKETATSVIKRGRMSVPHIILVVVLPILVIFGGGFTFYWLSADQMEKEEQAYLALEGCTDPLSYEDFISRFPDSKHLDDVRARMEALQQEDAEWLAVEASHDVQRLEDYIRQYPNSPFEKRAIFLIDSLDYMAARNADTRDAYNDYLAKHPEGVYYIEAHSGLNVVEERLAREMEAKRQAEALAADSIAAASAEGVKAE